MAKLDAQIVPADFNPKKHILLVVELPRKNNKDARHIKGTQKMEDYLKTNYPYKYEIVSNKELNDKNSKYSDTSIYKYAILNNLNGVQHTTHTTVTYSPGNSHTLSPSATTTYISYHFFDRVTKTEYNSSYQSPYINIAMGAFINTMKKAKKI